MRRDTSRLESQHFDIAVVGGGMHGAWLALRAAEAGHSVALVERDDFGSATSTNSLNILHGGLRYLQHLDFARMRSSIRARREFCQLFPHLVQPLRCVMPLRAAGVRSPWTLAPALLLNDLISADRNAGVTERARLPAGRLLGRAACRELIAPLALTDAVNGAQWWDVVTIDAARLALETIELAARNGALVANRVEALEYLVADRGISGIAVRDRVTRREFEVKATVVVNATGPWAGELSARSQLPHSFLPPGWVGGLNVVLRRSLHTETAVALSAASMSADRSAVLQRATRELFFVPWRGVTVVGTDYCTVADAGCAAQPPASVIDRFVSEIAYVAPRSGLSRGDVAAVQWGLLPQDESGAVLPRKAPIVAAGHAETGVDGLVVVIGEKLTSAPTLSRTVLQLAEREMALVGHTRRSPVQREASMTPGWSSRDEAIASYCQENPRLRERILPGDEAICAEVVHGIREEMALGLDDLVLRRVGLGHVGHPGIDALRRCATIAAPEFGWSAVESDRAVADLDAWFLGRTGEIPVRGNMNP
jgi:glycerol-3-phosphate dehydrogenase